MPKHAAVFICIVYVLSQSAFAGKYVDCRNMHSVSNVNFANTKLLKTPTDDHHFKDNRQKILKLFIIPLIMFYYASVE